MRKSTLLLACFSLVAVAGSYWLWTQWQFALSENRRLQERVSALELPSAEPRAIIDPPVAPELPAAPPPAPASGAPASTTAATNTWRPRYPGELQQRLMKIPEYRGALLRQQRLLIEAEFRDLPGLLGLSPEQADQLFDLMARQGVRILEAQWGKPGDGRPRQDAYREARFQNEAELTEFLGHSNMIRLQEFRSTLQSRSEVASVRNELARSSEPLRQDQIEPMVALVHIELQKMNQELKEAGSSQYGGPSDDPQEIARRAEAAIAANSRIAEAARTILSSAQLAALKDLYRHQRLQMEAQSELSQLRGEVVRSATKAAAQSN
jgi:hypothetical protein